MMPTLDGFMISIMSLHIEHENLFKTGDGHLRAPFAQLAFYLQKHGISPSVSERRAIENATQFLLSLSLFSHRMRSHLQQYRTNSWVEVPFYELFLDTQSIFLFTQQYLEDVSLILRMSLPHEQRHQMPASFTKLSKRIRMDILGDNDPLAALLIQDEAFWEEFKDVRDDICHRTAYDKVRAETFPSLSDLVRSGGGVAAFLTARDLRDYIGQLFRRTLALSCAFEDFVYARIIDQHPNTEEFPPAIVVAAGKIDFAATSKEPIFPLGTIVMQVERSRLDDLEYFIGGPVTEPPNSACS